MKKLLIIIGIALLFLSCTTDEVQGVENCECNAWVKESGMTRTVMPLELDCVTGEPINLPEGFIFLGCDNDDIP
jgi:hypothetical protein